MHTVRWVLGIGLAFLTLAEATSLQAGSAKKDLAAVEVYAPDDLVGISLDLEAAWRPLDLDAQAAKFRQELSKARHALSSSSARPLERTSALARAIKSGYSVGAEPEHLPAEMRRAYTVMEGLKADIRAGFNAPMSEEMNLMAAGAEARLALGQLGPSISWSWHTGLDLTLQNSGTNILEAGPQFKLGGRDLALTFTPKLAHNFGPDHANDVAFAYAAGLKGELATGLALGIEAFGSTADISTAPGTALQSHHAGSGIYVGLGLAPRPVGDGSRLSFEFGALAATSENAPDLTGKFKAALTW